ncbi:MAG: cysteine desulfurase family protein [Candidatus Aenigmatarchaeota archaeon]
MSLNGNTVYADNNATTPVDPRVKEVMEPYFEGKYGNPNSLHGKGREAREAVEEAREKVASLLNAEPEDVVFTSCATESNNHAVKGTAFARKEEGKHIITTKIEHDCVLNTCRWLERQGFDVTYLDVDEDGFVRAGDVEDALRDDTILVSVIMANNEIGTIEPIGKIAEVLPEDVYLHTDAAQAPGKLKTDVEELGLDMLTINGHKMYAPKGVGALWIRDGLDVDPLIHGGGQEGGRRSGTENLPYIVGFGKAAELAENELKGDQEKLREMQRKTIKRTEERVEDVTLNGPRDLEKRLPGNLNFSFEGVEGEALVLRLDERGIEASTGSACASEELEASHVLQAIGLGPELAHSSLRLGYGRFNKTEEVDRIVEAVAEEVEDLRSITAVDKKGKVGD